MAGSIHVMVVDDHRMFAEALELLLEGEEDMAIAGIVGSAEDALATFSQSTPDVVLMDLDLPGMGGIEATRLIRELSPPTQVVIITAFQEPDVMAAAVEAGACGFVPKTQAAEELVGVIRRAAAGEIVLPRGNVRSVLGKLGAVRRPRSDAGRLVGQLTSREIEILQALARGITTREVAEGLGISQLTAQTHVKNILAKLGVHSKLEAVTFALRHDMIRVPERGERTGGHDLRPPAGMSQ